MDRVISMLQVREVAPESAPQGAGTPGSSAAATRQRLLGAPERGPADVLSAQASKRRLPGVQELLQVGK